MSLIIKETASVWQNIAKCNLPVVLYGMGNAAEVILEQMHKHGIVAAGIFASDEFVRGQVFKGYRVETYAQIQARLTDFVIVIAFASEIPEVLARFKAMAAEHPLFAPHLPLFNGSSVTDIAWVKQYAEQLRATYSLLADEQSRQVFKAIIEYRISGKPQYLWACESDRYTDLTKLFRFEQSETYLDLGAYDGDTIKEFLKLTGGAYREIIAVEADRRNYRKLEQNYGQQPRLSMQQLAVWDKETVLAFSDSGGRQSSIFGKQKAGVRAVAIDSLIGTGTVSYIKMDVEGAEKEALRGAKTILQRETPKLFIAAYHYDEDLFAIPLLLKSLNSDYKIYLRKHPYLPDWEINFFCEKHRDIKSPSGSNMV